MKNKLAKRSMALALAGTLVIMNTLIPVRPLVEAAPASASRVVLSAGLQRLVTAALHVGSKTGGSAAGIPIIVRLRGQALLAGQFHTLSLIHAPLFHALLTQGATDVAPLPLINAVAAHVSPAGLQALLNNPEVVDIAADGQHHISPLPALQEVRDQVTTAEAAATGPYPGPIVHPAVSVEPEAVQLVHADAAHSTGVDGRMVRVAIVDSGFDINQPGLRGTLATDARGLPLRADFTGTDLTDTVGHGTACASMIAAQGTQIYTATNATLSQVFPTLHRWQTVRAYSRFTIEGMAPRAKILSAKIFDNRVPNGGGYDSWIVRAIQWAVQNKADVISESFGGLSMPSNGYDPISQADEAAVRAGLVVLAANGNEGPGTTTVGSPAAAPDVIAVGASTMLRQFAQTGFLTQFAQYQSDNVAWFTSRGPTWDGRPRPDVVAPGAFGWALFPTNKSDDGPTSPPYTYGTFGGTSQATPVAAGVVALLIDAYHRAHHGSRPTAAYIKSVLMSSTDDLGYPSSDQGTGRINALRGVRAILHEGPSLNLAPNYLVGRALPGAPLSSSFTVTNTGSTVQKVRVTADTSTVSRRLSFTGQTLADLTMPYSFKVPVGVNKLTASVDWRRTTQIVLADGVTRKDVILRIALYDPMNRLIDYGYGSGSGFATTYAADPVPGRWVAVVTESGRSDNAHNRHFINVPYRGTVLMNSNVRLGVVTPATAVLAPGTSRSFTLNSSAPDRPGVDVATVRVRTSSGQVTTLPFARTAAIPFIDDQGSFRGAFTGPANTGLASEIKIYSFPVQPDTSNIAVALHWPDAGYGILALLLDPHGNIVNGQFNGVQSTSDPNAPLDLHQTSLQMFWTNPEAGEWQIAVSDPFFAGTQENETFGGAVTVNQGLVGPTQIVQTVKAGRKVALSLRVRNAGTVPQQVFGYATTGSYGWIPVQAAAGPLGQGNPVITNTQVFTFQTGFVPPGTKTLLSYAASISPSLPIDLALSDPLGDTRAQGVPGPVSFAGLALDGSSAVVSAPELVAGNWNGVITLQRSRDEATTTTVLGSTLALSRQPHPWIMFQTSLSGGTLTGRPLALDRGASGVLPFTIAVPPDTLPGSYTANLFVYSLNGDELGDVPVTINVTKGAPEAVPTALPAVNDVVSSAFFPEGQTVEGSTESLDVLNTGASNANGLLVLTQEDGQTVQTPFAIPAHTHSSLNINSIIGGDKFVSAAAQSDGKVSFGRVILRPDRTGSYSTGTPAAAQRWYFAEGYTVDTFHQYVVIYNPARETAHIHFTLVPDASSGHTPDVHTYDTTIGGVSRQAIDINAIMPNRALSIIVASSKPVVAERVLYFGTNAQGLTTRLGATEPSTDLFFDAGTDRAGEQTHFAVFNPGRRPANVQIVYSGVDGAMVGYKQDVIPPLQRRTYNTSLTLRLSSVGAILHSSQPLVAEKVTFFGDFRASQIGAEDSFGMRRSSVQWTFPGGTSGLGFKELIALTNETTRTATVAASFYDNNGKTVTRTLTVLPGSRLLVNVDRLTGVKRGVHGSLFRSLNGVEFYAEQHIVYGDGTAGLDSPGIPLVQMGPQP